MKAQQFLKVCISLASSFGILTAYQARTAPVEQLQFSGSRNILGFSAIGLSFTAEDSKVSVGFHLQSASHIFPSGNELRYDLLQGEGFSGTVLGVCTLNLPEDFDSWADADFGFLNLDAGNKYTVRIAMSDADWVIYDNQWAASQSGFPIPGKIDYPGGLEFFSGEFVPYSDLQFRVIPVPEPTTGTLLLLGAAGLIVRLHRG